MKIELYEYKGKTVGVKLVPENDEENSQLYGAEQELDSEFGNRYALTLLQKAGGAMVFAVHGITLDRKLKKNIFDKQNERRLK